MIGAYVIGQPGSGKSTLLRALTAGLDQAVERRPFAHVVYFDDDDEAVGAQLGAAHDEFPGTDRLSMSVQPKAVAWIGTAPYPVVIGEGDRLATAGFLDAMAAAAEHFDVVLLDTPDDVAATRRAGRGSTQDETWLRGRVTKVVKLTASRQVVRLDGRAPLDALVAEARARVAAFGALTNSLDPVP